MNSRLHTPAFKLAMTVVGLSTAILVFFNSCQGAGVGTGFKSSIQSCNQKPGLVVKLDLGVSEKQSLLKSQSSIYDKRKVQLGLRDTSSLTSKATEQTIASGTELAVLIDNECIATLSASNETPRFSGEVSHGRAAIDDLKLQAYAYTLPQDYKASEFEDLVNRDICVKGVSYNKTYQLSAASTGLNDPYAGQQQHLTSIKAGEAYKKFYKEKGGIKKTGAPVVVAVIDTGIDWVHPDLVPNIWKYRTGSNVFWGLDATTLGSNTGVNYNPIDDAANGHGSHVAGLVAAVGNNAVGVSGVMPFRAEIMAIKVFKLSGSGSNITMSTTTEIVTNAIRWAADHGAQVINLSLTRLEAVSSSVPGSGRDAEYEAALEYAIQAGSFVVAAAGNSTATYPAQEINNTSFTSLPARYGAEYNGMLTVGSYNIANGARAYFSHFGTNSVEIAAPGTQNNGTNSSAGIFSTVPLTIGQRTGYSVLEGTSMSAPMVSAAAALVIGMIRESYGLVPNPSEIESLILASAKKSTLLTAHFKDGNQLDLDGLADLIHQRYPLTKGDGTEVENLDSVGNCP